MHDFKNMSLLSSSSLPSSYFSSTDKYDHPHQEQQQQHNYHNNRQQISHFPETTALMKIGILSNCQTPGLWDVNDCIMINVMRSMLCNEVGYGYTLNSNSSFIIGGNNSRIGGTGGTIDNIKENNSKRSKIDDNNYNHDDNQYINNENKINMISTSKYNNALINGNLELNTNQQNKMFKKRQYLAKRLLHHSYHSHINYCRIGYHHFKNNNYHYSSSSNNNNNKSCETKISIVDICLNKNDDDDDVENNNNKSTKVKLFHDYKNIFDLSPLNTISNLNGIQAIIIMISIKSIYQKTIVDIDRNYLLYCFKNNIKCCMIITYHTYNSNSEEYIKLYQYDDIHSMLEFDDNNIYDNSKDGNNTSKNENELYQINKKLINIVVKTFYEILKLILS
jgi:hypothetical protein